MEVQGVVDKASAEQARPKVEARVRNLDELPVEEVKQLTKQVEKKQKVKETGRQNERPYQFIMSQWRDYGVAGEEAMIRVRREIVRDGKGRPTAYYETMFDDLMSRFANKYGQRYTSYDEINISNPQAQWIAFVDETTPFSDEAGKLRKAAEDKAKKEKEEAYEKARQEYYAGSKR
jgi:hypothetical protein